MVVPPPLRPGDVVRVVAPSGPIPHDVLDRGVAVLRDELGLRVEMRPDVTARQGYLAGDDVRRAEEWREAVADPRARAIFIARGGYGAMHLLPALDPGRLAAAPRWVVGFSDATAIHAALNLAGLVTLHGPTVSTLGRAPTAVRQHLAALLFARAPQPRALAGQEIITPGTASGPLVGGCLSILAHLCGTPWLPRIRGSILFLEDVNEKRYQLDRYLTQLRLAGALDGVRGVCLGQFTACEDGAQQTVRDIVRSLGVPAIDGLPAGHVDENYALPLGRSVTIAATGAPELRLDAEGAA